MFLSIRISTEVMWRFPKTCNIDAFLNGQLLEFNELFELGLSPFRQHGEICQILIECLKWLEKSKNVVLYKNVEIRSAFSLAALARMANQC